MTNPTDTADDLFGQPTRGAFPKLEELEGRLVLVKPSKVDVVPGYRNVGTQERITADVVILDDPSGEVETYDDMYLSQKGLVPMLKKCLKPGTRHPFVLGRVEMAPTKDYADAAEKAGGIKALLEEWAKKGGKGEKPQFFWNLAEFSPEDAQKARAYLAATDQFAASAG